MPKRQHETEIWNKRWFRELSPKEKIAFMYIKDNCDCVGVWDADFVQAEFLIGSKIDWNTLIGKINKNAVILDNGKWYLKDFCTFQYGDLKPDSKSNLVHNIIKKLKKHGLWDEERECIKVVSTLAPTVAPTVALQYKEKEKDKYKEKDKEKEKEYAENVFLLEKEYLSLCERFGKIKIDGFIEQISDWQKSKGKGRKYKDYAAAIKDWMRRDADVVSVKELEIPKIPKCPKCHKPLHNEIQAGRDTTYCCNVPVPKSRDP